MERENELYLQSPRESKKYFITLDEDGNGIYIENVYSKFDITLNNIFINHVGNIIIQYMDINRKWTYSTTLTDGLEFIKIEECPMELTQEIYNEYLALKYIYIVESQYPRNYIMQGELAFCRKLLNKISKLVGYSSSTFHRYIKEFNQKVIRDEWIVKEASIKLEKIEELYDIPKHILELKG